MTDTRDEVPSPEEFESRGGGQRRGGLLRPVVHLVRRLRLKQGVGERKYVVDPRSPGDGADGETT